MYFISLYLSRIVFSTSYNARNSTLLSINLLANKAVGDGLCGNDTVLSSGVDYKSPLQRHVAKVKHAYFNITFHPHITFLKERSLLNPHLHCCIRGRLQSYALDLWHQRHIAIKDKAKESLLLITVPSSSPPWAVSSDPLCNSVPVARCTAAHNSDMGCSLHNTASCLCPCLESRVSGSQSRAEWQTVSGAPWLGPQGGCILAPHGVGPTHLQCMSKGNGTTHGTLPLKRTGPHQIHINCISQRNPQCLTYQSPRLFSRLCHPVVLPLAVCKWYRTLYIPGKTLLYVPILTH